MTGSRSKQSPGADRAPTPLLELLLGTCGALLLAGIVSFLIYDGLTRTERPGNVEASVTEIVRLSGQFLVRYEVRNQGTQALSGLEVEARLLDGAHQVARARVTLDYLPGEATRRGGFYFDVDPRLYQIRLVPEGYQEP